MNLVFKELRPLVVASQDLPFLGGLLQELHSKLEAVTASQLFLKPALGVFSRSSLIKKPSHSGFSDYDLTVLTPKLNNIDQIEFLNRFWKKYYSLRKFLPMVGEVEIYDPETFEDYVNFGPSPFAASKRLSLFPSVVPDLDEFEIKRCLHSHLNLTDPQNFKDALNEQILRWMFKVVPNNIRYQIEKGYVLGQKVQHVHRGFHLSLKAISPLGGKVNYDENVLFHHLMKNLDQLCDYFLQSYNENHKNIEKKEYKIESYGSTTSQLGVAHQLLVDFLKRENVSNIFVLSWRPNFGESCCLAIVCPDNLEEKELQRLLDTLSKFYAENKELFASRSIFNDVPLAPILMTRKIFDAWTLLNPLETFAIAKTLLIEPLGSPPILPSTSPKNLFLEHSIGSHYAGTLTLINNWRLAKGNLRIVLYKELSSRIAFYSRALDGNFNTESISFDADSLVSAYSKTKDAMGALKAKLVAKKRKTPPV